MNNVILVEKHAAAGFHCPHSEEWEGGNPLPSYENSLNLLGNPIYLVKTEHNFSFFATVLSCRRILLALLCTTFQIL